MDAITQTTIRADDVIVEHPYFTNAKAAMRRCLDSYEKKVPRCIGILGLSGSGKTTVIEEFVKEYINAENESDWQRPILVVETPTSPTVKSMASEVLLELGDPLYDKGSQVNMTNRIIMLMKEQGIKLLIFDEMQNLVDRDSAKLNHKAADWLKRLINKSHVPTVVVGLVQTEKLFLANEQLRRRFVNPYILPAFDWNNLEKRKVLRGFLDSLQRHIPFDEGLSIASSEMAFRFYCATGGLVGYIMSIVCEAADIANECHKPIICMDHLAQAYANVVCGNYLIGVNPFSDATQNELEAALEVVEPSAVTKGVVPKKASKRKDGN